LFPLLITLELLLYVGLVPWILNRPRWLCRKCGSTFRDL
jgi:hypothetical protein